MIKSSIYSFNNHELSIIAEIADFQTILQQIAIDLHIDLQSYNTDITYSETNDDSVCITAYLTSVSDKNAVRRYTVIADDFTADSLLAVAVLADSTNDIIRYTVDNCLNELSCEREYNVITKYKLSK